MNVTTATPAEIDTVLAGLWADRDAADAAIASAVIAAHQALGERSRYVTRTRREWPTTADEAIAKCREIADPAETYIYADGYRTNRAVTNYDAAVVRRDAADAKIAPLNAEFARRNGWTRFFLVDNNGGHIHSSQRCQTCNRRGQATSFSWLPEWSGRTEAEALAALAEAGNMMCTVCFPNAPVVERAPRPTREQIAAARAEAARRAQVEDPKLIAAPDGSPLRVDGDTLRTVRSADIAAVGHLVWAAYGRHQGQPNEPYAAEHEVNARTIAAALAFKAGTTEDEEMTRITAKAVAKIRKEMGRAIADAAAAHWAKPRA